MGEEVEQKNLEYKGSRFRVAILLLIVLLIMVRFVGLVVFPNSVIIPTDVFFAFALVQLFFLWFDSVKEKNRMLLIQKKKEALVQMKQKFILITSHELRTPMAILLGYLDLLRSKALGEVSLQQEKAIAKMDKQISRLSEILENLSKLFTGMMPYTLRKLEPVSIEVIIRGTVGDILPFVIKRKQDLKINIQKNIPLVMMDKNGIKQVLQNLLLNAIRFTPDEGKIVIRAEDKTDHIRVEVEDTGIGINEEELSHIFESFYEASDTTKHSSGSIEFKSGGMGLGLTIAKNTIDAHKGNIWAESEEGKYSRFIFTLPKWK